MQETAVEAQNFGRYATARYLYRKLLEKQEIEEKILFQAIKVFDFPGYEREYSLLLEKYLKRNPDYLLFRKKLVDYYLSINQYDAALVHVVYLSDHLEENGELLLQAGNIYLYQLARPDKSLNFFERYLVNHPESEEIKQKIADIQRILANDFLSIVENDGAWMLWRDLAKVTPNRVPIYLQMADLL